MNESLHGNNGRLNADGSRHWVCLSELVTGPGIIHLELVNGICRPEKGKRVNE